MKASDELKIFIFALACIVFLESYALYKGVDGVMFGSSMAGIGTIGGYILKSYLKSHKRKK